MYWDGYFQHTLSPLSHEGLFILTILTVNRMNEAGGNRLAKITQLSVAQPGFKALELLKSYSYI